MKYPVSLWIALITLIMAWGIVGKGDYKDAKVYKAHQCEMIYLGHWPESVNRSCKP